jgi:hypothetical protein
MDNAVWLMPSREEQLARLERRHPDRVHHGYLWGWQLIRGQLDAAPDTATIVVDNQTVSETLTAVESHFADRLTAGPRAQTVRERQHLLRYANQILVSHSLTGLERGFLSGDPSTIIRTFDCECADSGCVALVDLPVGDAAAALTNPPPSLLAPGHRPASEAG